MKILAVDDDPVFMDLLLAILTAADHEVLTARDGVEGWEMYNRDSFALVLCDWIMPRLNGLDLCRLVRKTRRPQYPYVILITSQAGRTSYLEGMEAGADDFIEKPIDADLLLARVGVAGRILGLHSHVQTLEGMLSICCYCKRIKDSGKWTQMERYISQRTPTSFSHCICEECFATQIDPSLQTD